MINRVSKRTYLSCKEKGSCPSTKKFYCALVARDNNEFVRNVVYRGQVCAKENEKVMCSQEHYDDLKAVLFD